MKRLTKPADAEAAQITFGVEIETKLPRTAQVADGGYHVGVPVRAGRSRTHQGTVLAPTLAHIAQWHAMSLYGQTGVKATPEIAKKIKAKKVANVLEKVFVRKKTPTATEEAILAEAGLSEGQTPGYVGTWDDLAAALGVTRRAIQNWRDDPRYQPEIEKRWSALERADGRKCMAAWLQLMVDLHLKRGAAAAEVQFQDEDDAPPGMLKPPLVAGSQAQWNVAIAALDHRRRKTACVCRRRNCSWLMNSSCRSARPLPPSRPSSRNSPRGPLATSSACATWPRSRSACVMNSTPILAI